MDRKRYWINNNTYIWTGHYKIPDQYDNMHKTKTVVAPGSIHSRRPSLASQLALPGIRHNSTIRTNEWHVKAP
jgi:hypothetical protein